MAVRVLDRLRDAFRRKPNGHGRRGFDGGIPSSGIYGDPRFLREGFPEMGGSMSNAYEQHSWTFASIRAIGKRLSAVPWGVFSGPEEEPIAVTGHEMLRLFRRPSTQLTRSQVWIATFANLALNGSCVWLLLGASDVVSRDEWPVEVVPLSGGLFEPLGEDGQPLRDALKRPAQWRLRSATVQRTFEPFQLARFGEWSPKGLLQNQAIVRAAEMAIGGDYQAAVWNLAFFLNSCDPGGWVKVASLLTDEQFRQLKKHWNDQHRGSGKRGETAFLEGGAEFTPNPRSQKEMEFRGLREMARDETIAVIGATKAALNITEDLSYANHEGQERILAEQTLVPILTDFREVLQRDIFDWRDGGRLWPNFDRKAIAALNSDFGVRVDSAVKLANLGWTPNQLNERLNLELPPAPNGDEPIVQTGGLDLGFDDAPPTNVSADANTGESADLSAVAAGGAVSDTALNGAQIQSLVDIVSQVAAGTLPASSAIWIITAAFPTIDEAEAAKMIAPAAALEATTPDAAPADALAQQMSKSARAVVLTPRKLALWQRDSTIRRPAERRVQAAIAKWYRTVAQDTLAAFGRATRKALTEEQSDLIKGLREKWDALIQDLMRDPLMDAMRLSATQAAKELGAIVDMSNPKLLELHAERIAEMVQVSERLQDAIRDKLIHLAVEENASIDWQREQLKGFFEGNTGRALRVARTETGIVQEGARYETFADAGVEKKEWVSSNDFAVRDSHREADGEIVDLDKPFTRGLSVPMMHPMEIGAPASEVVNCRCSAMAVV